MVPWYEHEYLSHASIHSTCCLLFTPEQATGHITLSQVLKDLSWEPIRAQKVLVRCMHSWCGVAACRAVVSISKLICCSVHGSSL